MVDERQKVTEEFQIYQEVSNYDKGSIYVIF